MKRLLHTPLPLLLLVGGLSMMVSGCTKSPLANKVWEYSLTHPEGFTLHISTMTAPQEGIAVGHADTQDSHSLQSLRHVVSHAVSHNGYVGGWRDTVSGRYYFDSVRLFPEDSLDAALTFARVNGQQAVYVLSTDTEIRTDMPVPPDYNDAAMWHEVHRDAAGTQADIFYVCSTETGDWTDEATGLTMHFADVRRPEHRAALLGELAGVDSLLNSSCNFYAPYYRQATMEGLLADTTHFIPRSLSATADVERAFRHYLIHKNNGRPFILMGYSQGGFAVVELLKKMPDEVARRMVAAYVIGYKVTASDLNHPTIRPAKHSDDTGVTICYNSVSTPSAGIPVISGGTAIGINPANWTTSNTPAVLCDTLTATLDTASHLVCIQGFSAPYRVIPFVGKVGNYHTLEIPLYTTCLRYNILERTAAWRKRHAQ